MKVQRLNSKIIEVPFGPYTHSVIHANTLYTSGFTAFGSDAQKGSISEQAIVVFAQLKIIAEEMNSSMDDLVKVTIFVTDLSDMANLRDTLFNIYGASIPASSLIKIDQLFTPELKIEVEAIFAL